MVKIEENTVGCSKPGAPLCSNWCGGRAVRVDGEYIKVPATNIHEGLDSIIYSIHVVFVSVLQLRDATL